MKKALLIIACIIVGILLTAGGVFATLSVIERLRIKNDDLNYCSVSTGGGMLGGYTQATLRTQKDGSVVYEVRKKETHADREVTTVYPASPEAFAHIKELVQTYNLYGASKRRYSDMFVLDGDTTRISFSGKNSSFSVSDTQDLNRKMRTGFREVERYLSTLATGEGETTVEPQTAMLYLKSGYTLQFIVENAFDGKLDAILGEEREVSAFGESGIVLCAGEQPDCSGAAPVSEAGAGTIVYDGESGQIVLLYADYAFKHDVWILAALDGYVSHACPLIAEMEGTYRLFLN
jgi:hypothetical protein